MYAPLWGGAENKLLDIKMIHGDWAQFPLLINPRIIKKQNSPEISSCLFMDRHGGVQV